MAAERTLPADFHALYDSGVRAQRGATSPALLAVVLLLRSPAGAGLGVGLRRLQSRDVLQGLGFCALIGIPGLGLVWTAYELGFNTQLATG